MYKHKYRRSQVKRGLNSTAQACTERLEERRLLANTWVTFSINSYYGQVAESHVENGVTLGSGCSLVVNHFWDGPYAPGGSINVTIGGNATSEVDYTPCSAIVSIPGSRLPYPGGGSQVIAMTTVPDNLVEGPESIELSFSTSDTLKLRPFGLPDWIPYTPIASAVIVDSPPIVNIYPVQDG